MKTLRTILIACFAAFMLSACGGGSPEAVAENFQKAIMDGDFKKASGYATKTTAPLLEQMGSFLPADQLQEMKKEFKQAKVKIIGSKVDGDTASVTIEIVNGDGEADEMHYDLVKEDGSWKIDFKK